MPNRVIRGDVLSSDSLSRVSIEASNLFLRMLLAADDYGRMDGRAAMIRTLVFPLHEVGVDAVESWLAELETCDADEPGEHDGPIRRYRVGPKYLLAFVNWEVHRGKQKRANQSKYPAPPWEPPGDPGIPGDSPADPRGSPRIPDRGDEVTRWGGDEEKRERRASRAPRGRKTTAPDDLVGEDRDRVESWALGVFEDPQRALAAVDAGIEACLGHFRGSGGLKADWPQTCINWIRRDENERRQRGREPPLPSLAEAKRAAEERARWRDLAHAADEAMEPGRSPEERQSLRDRIAARTHGGVTQ